MHAGVVINLDIKFIISKYAPIVFFFYNLD